MPFKIEPDATVLSIFGNDLEPFDRLSPHECRGASSWTGAAWPVAASPART
jgi:hypothetical protein